MRKTYRERKSPEYWTSRWNQIPVDAPAEGHDRYPLLYANMVVRDHDGEVLELGCGPGRLVRYYHAKGTKIVGVDNVAAVVTKLQACDPQLHVVHADARTLPFETGRFHTALCFGVYHSLEHDVAAAISETFRVLRPGGRLCAEFRSDSLHNRMIDYYKGSGKRATEFHKWNYRRQDARAMLMHAGFLIESEYPAFNIMYHSCGIHRKGTATNTQPEFLAIACGRGSKPYILSACDFCPGSSPMSISLFVANPGKLPMRPSRQDKEVAKEPDAGVVFWTHKVHIDLFGRLAPGIP